LESKQFFLQGGKPKITNITGGKHILTLYTITDPFLSFSTSHFSVQKFIKVMFIFRDYIKTLVLVIFLC
jgi:hypothetical protein